jgi:hypothetical protein
MAKDVSKDAEPNILDQDTQSADSTVEWQLVGSMELVGDLEEASTEIRASLKKTLDHRIRQLFE